MKLKQWLSLPLAAALLAAAPAMAAEKFRVGYLRVMDDAQAIVAQEGGYYKKAGLDSELIEFKSGTDLIKAIVGGQLDIGVLGFTNAVAWASKGADLKVVGGAQQGYHSLLVRDDSDIKDIAGLKGKTLASQAEGSTADVVLKGVVLKEGKLGADDVNVMGQPRRRGAVAGRQARGRRVPVRAVRPHRPAGGAGQADLRSGAGLAVPLHGGDHFRRCAGQAQG